MKLSIAQPTAPVMRLDVVQPSEVRSPLDRFRCGPYSATLTARSCVERQRSVGVQDGQRTISGWSQRQGARLGDYTLCRSCSIGSTIAKQVAS